MLKKFGLVVSLCLPLSLWADDHISYSWLEVGVQHADLDDSEWQSLYIEGSYGFNDYAYVVGGYKSEVAGDDVDLSIINLGLGFHGAISDGHELYGELGVGRFDVGSNDRDFYAVKLGTRHLINKNFEIITGIEHQEPEKSRFDNRLVFELNGLIKLSDPSQAIKVGLEADDDDFIGLEVGYRKIF